MLMRPAPIPRRGDIFSIAPRITSGEATSIGTNGDGG